MGSVPDSSLEQVRVVAALLFTLAAFAAFCLIGLALLALVGARTGLLWIALSAPIIGTAATVLPLFVISHAGAPMGDAAWPVVGVLLAGSVVILAIRRPEIPLAVLPVAALCLVNLVLIGHPMLDFGFRWLANSNGDMADYVLSATNLLHHGLLGPVDIAGIRNGFHYTSALNELHNRGGRPGGEITLSAFAAITGREPSELFMPFTIALQLCAVCGTAALAAQTARRQWAATVAAALLVASPLAAFSALQQLMPQAWGLGLAATLLAFVLRLEAHREPGMRRAELLLVGLLVTAILVAYVEFATTLVLVYAAYLAVLAVRREVDLRAVARLWLPAVVIPLVVVNVYLFREVDYMQTQAAVGVGNTGVHGDPPIFGYALVPGALTGFVGLQVLAPNGAAPFLNLSLLVALALIAAIVLTAVVTAIRGVAVSIVLVAYGALGLFLALKNGDRGVFKLYLYAQPFVAAAVAVWLTYARRIVLGVAAATLALIVMAQLSTQQAYVKGSRDPIDLHHASTEALLPAFRQFLDHGERPIVAVTDNVILEKLLGASLGERRDPRLFFVSLRLRPFSGFAESGWVRRSFALPPGSNSSNPFSENVLASRLLSSGRCRLVLATGSQTVFNRRTWPEGTPDLVDLPCTDPRNLLVFTSSDLGAAFFDFSRPRKDITLYQPQPDPFYRGKTFISVGRYLLFRVLRPETRVRLVVDLTMSALGPESTLPPAAVVGASREPMNLVGRGSARTISAPVRPQMIAGQPFVLLDVGKNGRLFHRSRHGLQGLYGSTIPLDPRYLSAYLRDVSLIGNADYRRLRPPRAIQHFPDDLANPNLQYSGISEEGWVGRESYVVFAPGAAATLVLRADVPPREGQRLDVLVNGRHLASRAVAPGRLELRIPVPSSRPPRRIELRWAGTARIGPNDPRRFAALLRYVGLAERG